MLAALVDPLVWSGVEEVGVKRQTVDATSGSAPGMAPTIHRERRRTDRMVTLYRVGSLEIEERRDLCLIKNICPDGMMVRTYCSILEGSRITIELKCGRPISGTVSWARDAHAGISFDEPIDVIDTLSIPMTDKRPRIPRIKVDGLVTLREGAFACSVQLCDISQGGLRVRCEKALSLDSHVMVTIQGIAPQPAVVRWIDGHYMGVKFNRMLALPVLVEWLRDRQNPLRTAKTATSLLSAQL